MKIQIKHLIVLLIIIVGVDLNAQIFSTKNEIIQLKGKDYTTNFTDDGNEYMLYINEDVNRHGETYYYSEVFILYKVKNIDEPICLTKKLFQPSYLINEIVPILKRDYVEIGYLKFKDYETDMIYDVELKEGEDYKFCIITIYHDNKE